MSNRLYNQFSYSPERQPISLMGKFIQASVNTPAQLINQGVTYIAKTTGTGGNAITIRLINPAGNGALSIAVVGSAITVTLAKALGVVTTTADDIAAAILGNGPANALVEADSDGSPGALVALAATHLAGGTDRLITTNAMNMTMAQTADGIYTITLQDDFPQVLSAQVSVLSALASSRAAQIVSADTTFNSAKTVVIRVIDTGAGSATNLPQGDGLFVHLILRNSSN